MSKYEFSSESVTAGHPDKICDQVSDAILDAHLRKDSESRVAVETFISDKFMVIGGEVRSSAKPDLVEIAKRTITEIGYDGRCEFNSKTADIHVVVGQQSQEIATGVDAGEEKKQGAGDQGMMFGYATIETDTFMPMPIHLAHTLAMRLRDVREQKVLPYLKPDGKTQVTVEYRNGLPINVTSVLVSTHHEKGIVMPQLREGIIEHVIDPVVSEFTHEGTQYLINPAGLWTSGGPIADAGLTGRKIIVDTYGGMGRHGGGAFSGKDPSKVDRSAAYMARFIAKNLVAANLAEKCEVQLAYAIGVAEPVSVFVDHFGTSTLEQGEFEKIVRDNFPLTPAEIIAHLDLKRPIFQKTAAYGHFGREEFPWEQTDKAHELMEKYT